MCASALAKCLKKKNRWRASVRGHGRAVTSVGLSVRLSVYCGEVRHRQRKPRQIARSITRLRDVLPCVDSLLTRLESVCT
jgi:hypothetical protein